MIRKLSGHFYIDKRTFSIREPVVLHFAVTHSGSNPYWLNGYIRAKFRPRHSRSALHSVVICKQSSSVTRTQ